MEFTIRESGRDASIRAPKIDLPFVDRMEGFQHIADARRVSARIL